MEPKVFFYSTNGTDTHGPVTLSVLHQLYQDKVIGPGSYLCREGETAWHPLNPDSFRRQVAAPKPVPYEPPPFVPTPETLERAYLPYPGDSQEGASVPVVFNVAYWVLAVGIAIILALLQAPSGAESSATVSYKLGAFAAALLIVGLLPYLISLIFKGFLRILVRAIGVVVLAALTIVGQVSHNRVLRIRATAEALTDQMGAEARKQIAEKGHYDGNIQQAEANIQKLKDQAGDDNSETSRVMRDALGITQGIVDKVKASEEAEKACGSFDPATLTSLADIAKLRAGIMKLRVSQTDVLTDFQNYDDHCRDALAKENLSADTVNEFIAGARKGGHVDQAIAIWQLKIKLSDDHLARLDFLEKSWGSWNTKDGKLLFSDTANLDAYNALSLKLQKDVEEIEGLQKQIFQ